MSKGKTANESKLKSEIIKILDLLLGKENVEDTHGHYEFGCDIVFNVIDPFGQIRKYGIQLKDVDIDSTNIHEILGQLSVSFGHEYSLANPGRLDAIYVITSGIISPGAELSFKKANVGFRSIYLIDQRKMTPFLDKTTKQSDATKNINKET